MGKLQFQPIPVKKSDKEVVETLVKETFALTRYNDRELTELEIQHEREAVKLAIKDHPRIFPRKATMGYMVRHVDGGNHQAIEYIRACLPTTNGGAPHTQSNLTKLVKEFDFLDEASQNRVDCLDVLARKHNVGVMKLIDTMSEGIITYHNKITANIIAEKKPELIQTIFRFAKDKKMAADRRLFAEISGATNDKPSIVVDNSKKVINNNNGNQVFSFSEFVKKSQETKQIEEKKDYVDGEVIEENGHQI